jgi:acetyltransferase
MSPRDLKSTDTTRDVVSITLRPVHPDDEPLLQDLFAHLSREDVRFRFFAPMRELSHALANRLLTLDYDRQLALVALHDGAPLGVARYAATDPDKHSAEYAIVVRSDWHGRGVGYLLLTRLMAIAAQHGIGELFGLVLHDNQPMLKMCRTLGFTSGPELTDATLIRVSKALGSPKS